MKLKGVNQFAQHIEKAVLGITILIFLAVISMQFVSTPNKVDTGSREVSPDQIYIELTSKANSLHSQISDLSPALPEISPVDLLSRYNNANADTITKLPIALGTGKDIANQLGITVIKPPTPINNIQAMPVPTTSVPLASSSWATLDPYAALAVPQFNEFIPTAQPFDFPSVSIEADFPGTELKKILEGVEGNDNYPGVPRLFWVSTGMVIMGLDVQRQQLQPDGTWSSSQPITTPPQTPLPTNAVTKDDGLVRLNTIIKNAKAVASQIMRPNFPPTISGPTWLPPSDALNTNDNALTDTQRLQRQLARLTTQLQGLKNPSRTTTTRPGNNKTRTTRDPGNNTRTRNTSDKTKDKIDRIETQIQSIKDDLNNLGIDTETAYASSDILDQDFVQLWAHDLGVTPGATYRYRTRAVLNNPYFRKGPYLDEADADQQALTVEPFARADWSQWSTPVTVGSKEFFFVTDATQAVQGPELPQAKIELYSMYYGYYRRSSMTIQPGQPLLANLRISGDLVLFDIKSINADDAATYIQNLNDSSDNASDIPDGITQAPNRLSINLRSFLIQITQDPISTQIQGQPSSRLIFRLPDGTLQYRNSTQDRSTTIYSQAQSSSAKAARSQLRPTGQPAISEAANLFTTTQP